MLFPLKHLNEMERRYPGVLALMQKKPENWQKICVERHVQPGHFTGMRALMHWRQDKVCYTFERNVAIEVFEQTADPDFKIPVTMMRHLPYPCIAIRIISFDLLDGSGVSLEPYTGLAYLWCEGDRLYSAWEFDSENYKNPDEIGEYAFTSAYLELKDGLTLSECFDRSVTDKLRRKFTASEVDEIRRAFEVENFSTIENYTDNHYDTLLSRFGEDRMNYLRDSFYLAHIQEGLMQRAIHYILYLNCSNADIERAEEKLKAGAWASVLGGNPREVKRNERRQALRENEGSQTFDVGYRIAGKFKRSYTQGTTAGNNGEATGSRGYGKRRAHYHHFWVGPRDGKLADDIMAPKPGERGLILKWLEATEIHPELRDDLATDVPVGRQD